MLRIKLQNNQRQADPEINQMLIANATRDQSVDLSSVRALVLVGRARHIRKGAFSQLPNLRVLTLPDNCDMALTTRHFINSQDDSVCENLRGLIVSAQTTNLHIALDHEHLSVLTILGEPRSLGDDIFANTRQFKQFYLPENCALVGLQQPDRLDAVAYHLQPMQIEQAGEVVFDDDLFVLSEDVDKERWLESLVYLALPEGVVVVSSPDGYCIERLRTLILPRSLQLIKSGTFTYYETLSYVSIHDNIESIETQAFICCPNIEGYDIFSHLPPDRFERYAFFDCNLARLTVPIEAGPVLNPDMITALAAALGIQTILIDDLTIPAHITRIEGEISNTLPSLTNLTFLENSRLEFIGERAFQGLSYLKFSGSEGVERLPASLYGIGAYAFANSCGLDDFRRKLSLPTPITLGARAFHQCDFAEVYFSGTGLATLGEQVFVLCRALQMVIFDGDVKLCKNVFHSCNDLQAIGFYQKVEIANGAFNGCRDDLRLFFFGIDPFKRYTHDEWHAKGIRNTGLFDEAGFFDTDSTVEYNTQLIKRDISRQTRLEADYDIDSRIKDNESIPNLFRRIELADQEFRENRRHP